MRVAAHRHLKSAQVLHAEKRPGLRPGCLAVAGYLFGLAGELAIKEMMRESGIRPLPPAERRDDPFYAHFPVLKSMLSTATGRRSQELRRLSETSVLFQNWNTDMRYAPTTEINEVQVEAWKVSAEKLIDQMGAA